MSKNFKIFGRIFCALLLTTFIAGSVSAQTASAQFVQGQVLIKFRAGIAQAQMQSTFSNAGIAQMESFPAIGVYLCNITNQQSVETAIQACQSDANIEYAEPNYIYTKFEPPLRATPNDPRFDELYAMQNSNDADIDAVEAWDTQKGSRDVLLGIIDTGVDYNHEDLNANMWRNPGESGGGKENNGVDDDGNGFVDDVFGWDFQQDDNDPMDDNGHGTHVAGTIGAVGDNSTGVVGVNWEVSIMALKFLDANGSGELADAIPAIMYAADMGALLTSNSWGGGGFSQAMKDAIEYARDRNAIFVAAAGNSGLDNDRFSNYPSNYDVDNIVAVAANDRNDNLASFSNTGKKTVDLSAPGVDIVSCQPGNSYQSLSGTSMATPHVSGVLGLVFTQYSGINYRDAMIRLLGSVDIKSQFNNTTSTGGRLNANNIFTNDPKIAFVTRMDNTNDTTGTYGIDASAIDDGAITNVSLNYNTGSGSQTVAMASTGGNQYSASIPAQPLGTSVSYFVAATDDQGNTSQTATFGFNVTEDTGGGGGCDGGGLCASLLFTGPSSSGPSQLAFTWIANMLFMIFVIWIVGRRNIWRGLRSTRS
ncbi:MAG: S8 family peptidase [bacterium]